MTKVTICHEVLDTWIVWNNEDDKILFMGSSRECVEYCENNELEYEWQSL